MVPSGNLTGCYWTLPIEIVDLPIFQMVIYLFSDGDFSLFGFPADSPGFLQEAWCSWMYCQTVSRSQKARGLIFSLLSARAWLSPPNSKGCRIPTNWGFQTFTLWWTDIAIENGHRNRWFPHYKLWFSIVMLVYQRFPICIRSISKLSQITTWKTLWWLHLAMKECNGGFSGTSPCFTRDRAKKISKMKMFTNRLLLIIGRLSRHPGFLSLCSTFPFSALPWRRYLSSWNHGLHNRPQVTQMVYLQWI